MKLVFKYSLAFMLILVGIALQAQSDSEGRKESDEPVEGYYLDDIVDRTLTLESKVLPYDTPREIDVPWEKKVWRIIETREKINIPFRNPTRPFFNILVDNIKDGNVRAFKDEFFEEPLSAGAVDSLLFSTDSTMIEDPETYEVKIVLTTSEINPDDINKYRIKEVWYFDKEASRFKVRILGIAPLKDEIDPETGLLKYENVLFWVYYPELREYLASEAVPSDYNDIFPMTWYDLFENRMFQSYIIKVNNVLDLRFKDKYEKSPTQDMDVLLESQKLKRELFNFEHDLWSY